MSALVDLTRISSLYERFAERVALGRERLGRPLTLTEKILFAHLDAPERQGLTRGRDTALLHPDHVALQDATAQMAVLQFMTAARERVALPVTVHCDHLITARSSAEEDLDEALSRNGEVFEFLRSAAARYGVGFWEPGAGIIHQVLLENHAFPGGLMIGTDSHTPNAGGLGMLAVGVGGADAVDAMMGLPWAVTLPKMIGVRLTGTLTGWTAPKDVILKLACELSVKGGTGAVVEYFGPGTRALSATGKATVTNMGAEIGATSSVFPFDERIAAYLRTTGRDSVADEAERYAEFFAPDPEVEKDPARFFERVIEIDLTTLEPHVVGPHTPDLARPISRLAEDARREGYPLDLGAALIGSCTNSSYEDLGRAAHIAGQAAPRGIVARAELFVSPGSERVRATIARDGLLDALEAVGARLLANACGPCIGQWHRAPHGEGGANSIVTSFNRNFAGRHDGNPQTHAFIASPEVVTALALAGRLDFNPLEDTLPTEDGEGLKLTPPAADDLPAQGFSVVRGGFVAPPEDGSEVTVVIAEDSERLQALTPFPAWDGRPLEGLRVLLRARGKCTTDHISAAGQWLRFRGHLENISRNLLLGATNDFTGEVGRGTDVETGERGVPLPELAFRYRQRGVEWLIVGDDNYGEGSSREHAAMEPRFLGGRVVVARSFARIHETNLKKQGILPLTFCDPDDYGAFLEDDKVDVVGLLDLAPGSRVKLRLRHAAGSVTEIDTEHTLTAEQVRWWQAGSAINSYGRNPQSSTASVDRGE